MATWDKITVQSTEHGQYQTRLGSLDLIIQRYLGVGVGPEEVAALQDEIRERQGDSTYTVTSVAEALMILAELDGLATN
jgi:hypothetical protein